MINYVVCDLFLSPATVLVNTVNTVGVMGKGIAKDFKRIYPKMFREYQDLCERQLLEVGKLHLFKTSNKWVLNFPTKRHWRDPSQVEYIQAGLDKFVATYHRYGITSISFPQLGCGNGELDWEQQVRPIMECYLGKLPITVFIHLAHVSDPFTPEHHNIAEIKEWLRQQPRSLAFAEVWDDLCDLLGDSQKFETPSPAESFTAHIDHDARQLVISAQGRAQSIHYESLTALWQLIRQSGFVAGSNLPEGLHTLHPYLLSLLAKLPYVELVVMSERSDAVADHPLGVRLQLRPQDRDLPLFASAGLVEPVRAG